MAAAASATLRRPLVRATRATLGLGLGLGGALLASPASASAAPGPRTWNACPEAACKGAAGLDFDFGADAGPRPRRPHTTVPALAPPPCPDDRAALGRHTWHFLHAVAAYYPEAPLAADREAAEGLVRAVARLYPCVHCRAAFEADIAEHPPRLASRADFSTWLCERHNRVNEDLGRPAHPCDAGLLDERWRRGRAACWESESGSASAITAEESLGQAEGES